MIYKFTDTTERAARSDLPAEALNINGKYLEDIVPGYRTLTVSGRESMSAEVNMLENGRANGQSFNFKRYPERVITIGFQILADSAEDYRKAFNALGGALNCEQAKLIFNDELDKYFIGTPGEVGEVEPGNNKVVGEFSIVCADPFKYSCVEYKTEVTNDTSKKILYGGTIPAFPVVYSNNTGGNVWFKSFSIDNNMLVFGVEGTGAEITGNVTTARETTDGEWTYWTETMPGDCDDYQITGKFRYKPKSETDIFKIDIYGNTGVADYAPRIRLYRDYKAGVPLTEVQFFIGSNIVYRQTIDNDSGDNRIPFRLSFSHSKILQSVRLGRMTGNYYFQVGDIIFEYRKSWAWNTSSDTADYTVDSAVYSVGTRGVMPSAVDGTIFELYDASMNTAGSVFPYNDGTEVKPETSQLLVGELSTPQWGNPSNRWENFKLQPGENTLKCKAFGDGESSMKATFVWREVFI